MYTDIIPLYIMFYHPLWCKFGALLYTKLYIDLWSIITGEIYYKSIDFQAIYIENYIEHSTLISQCKSRQVKCKHSFFLYKFSLNIENLAVYLNLLLRKQWNIFKNIIFQRCLFLKRCMFMIIICIEILLIFEQQL